MNLHIFKNTKSLTKALADWICIEINNVLKQQEFYTWALSGGSTPKSLYEILASDYKDAVDWKRIHFFWGDERFVPFEDEQNNAGHAYNLLLKPLSIPNEHIHTIGTDMTPEQSVTNYGKLLHSFFDASGSTFDLCLLGMGDDGHTLSIFPHHKKDLLDDSHWVKSVMHPTERMTRITLLPEFVNRSTKIVFMVQGKKKASTLHNVLKGKYQPNLYPSQLIKPSGGELHWFIDESAAQDLQ